MSKIRTKERDTILQSLRAGVVPRIGLHLIQVGRVNEISALIKDLDRLAEGGTLFRLIIGEYGSGKTFFLNLIKTIALEKKIVTLQADLSPNRRIHATGGQARSLFSELVKNLATRNKPDGGALSSIIEKFISNCRNEATTKNMNPSQIIEENLSTLSELVNGYDFISVLKKYWQGYEQGEEQLKSDALRWLRGEFTTKTDARAALGVRTIIDDASVYDQLKLLSKFIKIAGYNGLLICIDEMINLYKLANTQARNSNYEEILHILNDSLQGNVENLGFMFGGTPEFLFDPHKGLYSYSALQSRLAENSFAKNGLIDYTHPVLRLSNLTPEEFLILLEKLRHIFASGDSSQYLLPDEALTDFMSHCNKNIGESYFRTPRTTITAFINLLSVLEQNPNVNWKDLIASTKIEKDAIDEIVFEPTTSNGIQNPNIEVTDDEFTTFRLH